MERKILVTGGMGYLGGRLSSFLKNTLNLNIRIGTHRKTFDKPEWSQEFEVIHMDYSSYSSLFDACEGIDSIFHLAGLNEIECKKDLEKAIDVNVMGTHKLHNAALNQNVSKFFLFSTAHVYGSPLEGYIDEKTIPRPIHPYALVNKFTEDVVLSQNNGIVFRLSNGIGAPLTAETGRWKLVANDLCKQAVIEKELKLLSSGLQQRDFVSITDICMVCKHFLKEGNEYLNQIYNVGGENSLRIVDLANTISQRCEKLFGYKPQIKTPSTENYDNSTHKDLIYSIDKLKSTGFSLQKNILSEIDSTLEFCHEHFSQTNVQ